MYSHSISNNFPMKSCSCHEFWKFLSLVWSTVGWWQIGHGRFENLLAKTQGLVDAELAEQFWIFARILDWCQEWINSNLYPCLQYHQSQTEGRGNNWSNGEPTSKQWITDWQVPITITSLNLHTTTRETEKLMSRTMRNTLEREVSIPQYEELLCFKTSTVESYHTHGIPRE